MKKIILSAVVLTALVQAAPLGLKTQTEMGFIKNTGNTDAETFNLDANINKEWEKHIANAKITAQYGTEDNVETKKKWLGELTYDYKFTQNFAFNYLFGYKNDSFSSYAYQLYTGPGAKYIVLKSDTQNLNLAANILYSQDKNNDIGAIAGETNDYTSYRVALNYDKQIFENLKFAQELNYRSDFNDAKNYFLYSKSALITKISDFLSAGVSYIVDYTNIPNSGKEKADNTLTANLLINY